MKKFLFLLFVFIANFCYAHYRTLPIEKGNVQITTKQNSKIYLLDERYEWEAKMVSASTRPVFNVNISLNKERRTKILNKPQLLQVIAYTNSIRQTAYDTYVVLYKEKKWLLHSCDVINNSPIKQINASLDSVAHYLNSQKSEKWAKLEEFISEHQNRASNKIEYYTKLEQDLPRLKDSIESATKAMWQNRLATEYKQWYDKQPSTTRRGADAISINQCRLGSANSAGGCDIWFEYTNRSQKTIKYLYFTGTFYNAVNDIVRCSIRGYYEYTGKDTGPVNPGNGGGGVWDCAIYNYSADEFRLSNITIIYMDGTKQYIAANDIKRLLTVPTTQMPYDAVSKAAAHLPNKYECNSQIKLWQDRAEKMKYKNPEQLSKELVWYELSDKEYIEHYKKLLELSKEYNNVLKEIFKYNQFNLN